ncbi:Uncharacterized protein OS=Rhodopirellula sp. SWK7 GN=RRSWK_07228 PE=4 SV=1 [Gemmata massiliana]|uniref:Uncharacterized protein n=1 Tax=Gemmata massiliana TaxID=1210884 RepID=A0A6P2CQL3_9BACT|nr:Uncharacterized protein OS=Rhodopirellula sp. SWK7 GN=RRSWK_07228 PE=4 SV=1 [Gemmata massiliana]
MGEVFRYVADSALPAHRHSDLPCSICGAFGDVYYVCADIEEPDGSESPISEACVACIRRLAPEQVSRWATEKRLPAYLKTTPEFDEPTVRERLVAITQELRRTPRLPHFVQGDDWPFCCGDLTEYTGEPSRAEAELLDREGQYWDHKPASFHDRAVTLVPSNDLAVLGGVSAFRCIGCGKRYWTFQCT